MRIKSLFENDNIAVKSEGKKRCRQHIKKNRMKKTVNKHGGWLTEY